MVQLELGKETMFDIKFALSLMLDQLAGIGWRQKVTKGFLLKIPTKLQCAQVAHC